MSTEKNQAEKADKQIIAEDNARKTDLTQGTDAPLDDGTAQAPVKADPFESRKTLYAKRTSHRERRIEQEAASHPDVANQRQVMADEAPQGSSRNELDRGDHVDTNAPDRFERARMEAQGIDPDAQPVQRVNAADSQAHQNGADANQRVKVKVLGQEFEVPQSDIDEAGGVVAYQKDRAASMRLQQAAREQASIKAEREALEKERQALAQQRDSAGRNAPATSTGRTPGAAPTHQGGAGEGADVEAQAAAIANDLYSGDPKRAKAAIAKIMQGSSQPAHTLDPAEVARQAADLLKKQDQEPAPTPQQVDVATQVEINELNSMMAAKFGEVLENPDMKAKALSKFEELRKDPANRYRRLVDMGREAAQFALVDGKHPRQDIVDRKRALPPVPTGSQVHQPKQQQTMKSSDWMALQRKARGLPS